MRKRRVAVIDVGSSKITALSVNYNKDGSFTTGLLVDEQYGGFSEGEFFDENEFEDAVRRAFKEIKANSKFKFSEIIVGVPNAFIKLQRKRFKIDFQKVKKITNKDVKKLIETGENKSEFGGYELVDELSISFGVNGKKVFDPIGFHASELGGFISYIFARNSFLQSVRIALIKEKSAVIRFVSSDYAVGKYFLGDKLKTEPVIIADIGYISSSFSLLYGGGIVDAVSVDAGGGFITADLMKRYSIDLSDAETLKRSINLGLKDGITGNYKIQTDTGVMEFPISEINGGAKEVIDEAVGALDDFIDNNKAKFQGEIKVYLVGGGISRIRGAVQHVSARISTDVEILKPDLPSYDRPERSSAIALAGYAIGEK